MSAKTFRQVIIGGIVVVVLGAIAALVTLWPDPVENPIESATPSVGTPSTKYFVHDDFSAFARVDVIPADGERHAIVGVGDGVYAIEPAVEGWNYKQELLRSGAYNASAITALSIIADNATAEQLLEYGLTVPACEYRVEFNDTTEGRRSYSFEVGDRLAIGDSYYARIKGETTVYAISAYAISTFSAPEAVYRELNFFPVYPPDETGAIDTAGNISYIRLFDPLRDVDLEIRLGDQQDDDAMSDYLLIKPIEAFCVDDRVIDLHNAAVQLIPEAVVLDNPTDEQLTEFGFDNPREIWMEDKDGNSVHYTLGYFNETGAGFVMVEGCDSILTASGLNDAIFVRPYLDYMFKLIAEFNMSTLTGVSYNMPNGSRRMLSITNYSTENDNGRITFDALLDGQAITQTNGSRLYARTLNIVVDGELDPALEVPTTPDMSITYRFADGSDNVVYEFFELNERRYAVAIDGELTNFCVNTAAVKSLQSAFDYVDRGEEIPRT